jgi:hypothetical protein
MASTNFAIKILATAATLCIMSGSICLYGQKIWKYFMESIKADSTDGNIHTVLTRPTAEVSLVENNVHGIFL